VDTASLFTFRIQPVWTVSHFFIPFSLSPSFGLEVQVKGIAGFEGFHGGSLLEMKSAAVL